MATHDTVVAALSSMSDRAIQRLLEDSGRPWRGSIGGATRSIEVAGVPVFVKTIRVSDRELVAGPGDTRNLFDLPTWYQYGVGEGSTGFSAWREVAAHETVNEWVLTDERGAFPLLYHWRIIPGIVQFGPSEAEIVRAVDFWANSPEVETRLRALSASTTVVAMFLEHVPFTLRNWLSPHLIAAGGQKATELVRNVEHELLGAAERMRSEGWVHFDAHLDNVLTTSQHLVMSDFGLASSVSFQLDAAEQQFLKRHADHDVAYCIAELTNAILRSAMSFPSARARNDWIRRCAKTGETNGVPNALAATILRFASTTTLMNDFYWQLHNGNFQVQYPAAELGAALHEVTG